MHGESNTPNDHKFCHAGLSLDGIKTVVKGKYTCIYNKVLLGWMHAGGGRCYPASYRGY